MDWSEVLARLRQLEGQHLFVEVGEGEGGAMPVELAGPLKFVEHDRDPGCDLLTLAVGETGMITLAQSMLGDAQVHARALVLEQRSVRLSFLMPPDSPPLLEQAGQSMTDGDRAAIAEDRRERTGPEQPITNGADSGDRHQTDWNHLLMALLELNGRPVSASVTEAGSGNVEIAASSGPLAVGYWGSAGSDSERLVIRVGEARLTVDRARLKQVVATETGLTLSQPASSFVIIDLTRCPF